MKTWKASESVRRRRHKPGKEKGFGGYAMTVSKILMTTVGITAMGCVTDNQEDNESPGMVIDSEVSCPSCSVVLDSVTTLQGAHYSGPAEATTHDPDGLFYFPDLSAGDRVNVYGRDGRFVRQIGQPGGGPGEYEMVRNILIASDGSIRVLDGALTRLSRFARTGEFLGSVRVPVIAGYGLPAALLPDDRLVVNVRATRATGGHSVQVIDQEGHVAHSFDATPVDVRTSLDPSKLHRRVLLVRGNGDLLVARQYTFSIDVYDAALHRERSIVRAADWIPLQDPDEVSDGVYDKPFTPQLWAMWEDTQELLWLVMAVPSPLWKPGPSIEQVRQQVRQMGREPISRLAARARMETIIEVVDLEGGRVLARARFEGSIGSPFGGGYFGRSVQDPAGEPGIWIRRARLRR